MKVFAGRSDDQHYSKSFRLLLAVAIILFTIVAHDDTKLLWPLLVLAIGSLFTGSLVYKLLGLLVMLSWGYCCSVVLIKNARRRPRLVIGALGVLWMVTIVQGYGLITHAEALARNHWFVVTSVLFLISSLTAVLQLRRQ